MFSSVWALSSSRWCCIRKHSLIRSSCCCRHGHDAVVYPLSSTMRSCMRHSRFSLASHNICLHPAWEANSRPYRTARREMLPILTTPTTTSHQRSNGADYNESCDTEHGNRLKVSNLTFLKAMDTASTIVGAASSSHTDLPSPHAVQIEVRFESSTFEAFSGFVPEPTAMETGAGCSHPPERVTSMFCAHVLSKQIMHGSRRNSAVDTIVRADNS